MATSISDRRPPAPPPPRRKGPPLDLDPAGWTAAIRARAREIGFDAVGFAPARLPPATGEALDRFVELGRHGDMHWIEDRIDWRRSPDALWPGARSAIVLAQNYGPATDPLANLSCPETGSLSVYARGDDYHEVIKAKLRRLARWLWDESAVELKFFVDTAPVMEKPLAALAGLGWQGRHTNLVSRDFGSWTFLAVMLTGLDLVHDRPHGDRCGSCHACLDACPTNAFPAPYELDARRCISYLTIELDGPVPVEFRAAMGNRIYGCDDCLAVCPWNKFARGAAETKLAGREALTAPGLAGLAGLDDAAFRTMFARTAVKRIGRDRFVRNVVIAIGNSGRPDLVPALRPLLADGAAQVRAMAVWAASRLMSPPEFARAAAERLSGETDPAVLAEWRAAGVLSEERP
ncbi:tRNA epoxyqueuosine(34) reductase QueG [Tistrella mobilis]|uniref:tRNA epoxyqueuosine(34) reductase QueG n=1 Tax=Tistrella mobilis TaxID=171437 RepID=UPI003558776E